MSDIFVLLHNKILKILESFKLKECKSKQELRTAFRQARDDMKILRKEFAKLFFEYKEKNVEKLQILYTFLVFYLSITENGEKFLNDEEIIDNEEALRVIFQEIINIFLQEEVVITSSDKLVVSAFFLINRNILSFVNEICLRFLQKSDIFHKDIIFTMDLLFFYQILDIERIIKNTNFIYLPLILKVFVKKMIREMRENIIIFLMKSSRKNTTLSLENALNKLRAQTSEEDKNQIIFIMQKESLLEAKEKTANEEFIQNETFIREVKKNIVQDIITLAKDLNLNHIFS